MSRSNRTQVNRNTKRAASPAVIRVIAGQVKRLSDAELYGLTFSADRVTRNWAMRVAHARAEKFAMESES